MQFNTHIRSISNLLSPIETDPNNRRTWAQQELYYLSRTSRNELTLSKNQPNEEWIIEGGLDPYYRRFPTHQHIAYMLGDWITLSVRVNGTRYFLNADSSQQFLTHEEIQKLSGSASTHWKFYDGAIINRLRNDYGLVVESGSTHPIIRVAFLSRPANIYPSKQNTAQKFVFQPSKDASDHLDILRGMEINAIPKFQFYNARPGSEFVSDIRKLQQSRSRWTMKNCHVKRTTTTSFGDPIDSHNNDRPSRDNRDITEHCHVTVHRVQSSVNERKIAEPNEIKLVLEPDDEMGAYKLISKNDEKNELHFLAVGERILLVPDRWFGDFTMEETEDDISYDSSLAAPKKIVKAMSVHNIRRIERTKPIEDDQTHRGRPYRYDADIAVSDSTFFDSFFNGPFGYRAHYFLNRHFGESYERRTIHALSRRDIESAEYMNGVSESSFLHALNYAEASSHAKIWVGTERVASERFIYNGVWDYYFFQFAKNYTPSDLARRHFQIEKIIPALSEKKQASWKKGIRADRMPAPSAPAFVLKTPWFFLSGEPWVDPQKKYRSIEVSRVGFV